MKDETKVYLVRGGHTGEDEEYSLDHGLAIIGFRDFPSLEGKKDYNAIVKSVTEAKQDMKPRAVGNYAGQLWAFCNSYERRRYCCPPP